MLDDFIKLDATNKNPYLPRYEQWFPVDTTSNDYFMEGDLTLGAWQDYHPSWDENLTIHKASCVTEPLVVGYQTADNAGYKLGSRFTKMSSIQDVFVLSDSWTWDTGFLYVNCGSTYVNPTATNRVQAFSKSSLKFLEPQIWLYDKQKVPSEFIMTVKGNVFAGHRSAYAYAVTSASQEPNSFGASPYTKAASLCFYFGINDNFSFNGSDYTQTNPLLKVIIQSTHFNYFNTGAYTYKNTKHYRIGYTEVYSGTGLSASNPAYLNDTGPSYYYSGNAWAWVNSAAWANVQNPTSYNGSYLTGATNHGNLMFVDNKYDENTQTSIYGTTVLCPYMMWITIKYQDGILSFYDVKNSIYITSFQLPYRQILPGYFAFGTESYRYSEEVINYRDYVSCIAVDDLEVHGIVTDVKPYDIITLGDTQEAHKY
jgi:hypothetical protein